MKFVHGGDAQEGSEEMIELGDVRTSRFEEGEDGVETVLE